MKKTPRTTAVNLWTQADSRYRNIVTIAERSLDQFPRDAGMKSGLANRCRASHNAVNRVDGATDKAKQKKRAWILAKKDKLWISAKLHRERIKLENKNEEHIESIII